MKGLQRLPDGSIEFIGVTGYFNLELKGTFYCGWYEDEEFMRFHEEVEKRTDVGIERLWVIYKLAKQAKSVRGAFLECGVFAGGSAKFIGSVLNGSGNRLHLFDTWTGMPKTDPTKDWHREGDFGDVTAEDVRAFVGPDPVMHQGFMPDTFKDFEGPIAFAHVDVDIYQSMKDCCEFIYPRMSSRGVMVFDDYGQATCYGAREAINEFFADKLEVPLPIPFTKQAVVFKL